MRQERVPVNGRERAATLDSIGDSPENPLLRQICDGVLTALAPMNRLTGQWLRRLGAVVVAGGLVAASGPAYAKITERVLDNGLKVIIKEDHRAPTAIQMIWYKAGSMDEVNGRTGVAHVLEHLMFKGTPTVPDGEFSRRVAAAGGRENAFTNRDYTAYFQQIPPEALPEMIEMEADRMENLRLSQDPFDKEVAVVMEERRSRIEDNPYGQVTEQFMAQAYTASPYRSPVIGWMNDLQNLTREDALQWYAQWYAPNNAVLIIAGDVQPDQVMADIERTYGKIPRRELAGRRPQQEPEQRGIRRAVVKAPAQSPFLIMGFKTPRLESLDEPGEAFALEMLAAVLGSGDTGRLVREVVRGKRLANDADAGYSLLGRGPSMFTLSGTPLDGGSLSDLEAVLREQVARIARDGVDELELRRIKSQYVAGRIFGRDSLYGQVMEIGLLETIGFSHDAIDNMVEQIRKVDSNAVRAVAGKYFGDDQLTVVTLDPQPLSTRKPRVVDPSIKVKH